MNHFVILLASFVVLYSTPAPANNNLIQGFINNDTKPLLDFLNDWHSKSKPIEADTLAKKPKFEQEIYTLYESFYSPAEFYAKVDFVVVQNQINVQIVDQDLADLFSQNEYEVEDRIRALPTVSNYTVKDFRPKVRNTKKNILYLDDQHLEEMLYFLTRKNVSSKQLWELNCSSDVRMRRLRYLNKVLHIVPGHWGVGWHFETHPEVNSIIIDSQFKHAAVIFRNHYGGALALMQLKDGKWTVSKTIGKWTE